MDDFNLRYPIGEFNFPERYSKSELCGWIENIELFPERLNAIIDNSKLELRYRQGGWTVRQVVHHCADSHMNSLIRFKLALTEDLPTIKPYHEDRWAELIDYKDEALADSINIIEGVHSKLTMLLKSTSLCDLDREFYHPENKIKIKLWQNIALYSWHSNHHLAHIELAQSRA